MASGSETGARPLAAARSPRPAFVNPLILFRDLERLSSSYTGKKDSPMSMKDKTIVVTGGSRGLGLGLVEALAEQGAKVTIVARDATALAAARRRLASKPSPPTSPRKGRLNASLLRSGPRSWC